MAPKVFISFALISIFVGLCLTPCGANGKHQVTVSILPQRYFVGKIGGNLVTVSVMVLPGFNPATYEPKPAQLKDLHASKIYFAMGVPFEKFWLEKFKEVNPEMVIAYTDRGINKRQMAAHNHRHWEEFHGQEERNEKQSAHLDPHIWLSPHLVKSQARVIAEFLIRMDPKNKETYENNLGIFLDELDSLDRKIKKILEQCGKKKAFLVFHPTWGYFADHYGLKQIPLEAEGKEPGAAYLAECIRFARDSEIGAIFVQPQFSTKTAQVVARETGARVVVADPLSEDWERNLLDMAETLKLNSGVKEKVR